MANVIGQPVSRIDGALKVTGQAKYAADFTDSHVAHAALIQSAIAAGEVIGFDLTEAREVEGVIDIITHENAMKVKIPSMGVGTMPGDPFPALQSNEIYFSGQFIGIVVAETLEAARYAASLVTVHYRKKEALTDFEEEAESAYEKKRMLGIIKLKKDKGDFAKAFAESEVKIQHTYTTPMQFHSPMEPSGLLASWDGDHLHVYDSTQMVSDAANMYAGAFGLKKGNVHVTSKFIGGGFGCKGSLWSFQIMTAMAAKQIGRPVKLAVTREQMFTAVGHRARTKQKVSIGAKKDGTLTAIEHTSLNSTSVNRDYIENSAAGTPSLYKVENYRVRHSVMKMNVQTPTFMRAPGEAVGSFAIESAIDEMADAVGMDPIEFALKNYTEVDNESGKAYTSKSLRECYLLGAEKIGWSKRSQVPGALREGDELIGYGMAQAHFQALMFPASAVVELRADGSIHILCGTQDIGTGTYTVLAQVAADTLGVSVDKINVHIGESSLPKSGVSGGSTGATSAGVAVKLACEKLKAKLEKIARSSFFSKEEWTHANGSMTSKANQRMTYAEVVKKSGKDVISAKGSLGHRLITQLFNTTHAFGAQFAEVRINIYTGEVRVTKMVGAFAAGRIINPKTARSQLMGGMIMSVGGALMEHSELDENLGRLAMKDFGSYHFPVQKDLPDIDVLMIHEEDKRINPLGTKGIGEIGIVGMMAAIANAVYNATGVRVRDLPITPDKLTEHPDFNRLSGM